MNLEGSRLATARGELVVPIVTAMSEVLAVDVAAMLVVNNGARVDTDVMNPGTANPSTTNEKQTVRYFELFIDFYCTL